MHEKIRRSKISRRENQNSSERVVTSLKERLLQNVFLFSSKVDFRVGTITDLDKKNEIASILNFRRRQKHSRRVGGGHLGLADPARQEELGWEQRTKLVLFVLLVLPALQKKTLHAWVQFCTTNPMSNDGNWLRTSLPPRGLEADLHPPRSQGGQHLA